jgi:hypothetical protein
VDSIESVQTQEAYMEAYHLKLSIESIGDISQGILFVLISCFKTFHISSFDY